MGARDKRGAGGRGKRRTGEERGRDNVGWASIPGKRLMDGGRDSPPLLRKGRATPMMRRRRPITVND